ncbi:MAG: STAS domain-containing protein [Thermoanaerobaculia bacterium]|nr:STAS domain-containing protein [Thermoanaerobaculia bacterium]
MEVTERKKGDVTILEFDGRLTIGRGDVVLREAVHKALGEGRRKILLVLENCRALDSSGVGELMAVRASTIRRGGSLKLAKISPKVTNILAVTQLAGVLEPYDSIEEALADFAGLP